MHCLVELSGGVVQRNLKPAQAFVAERKCSKGFCRMAGSFFRYKMFTYGRRKKMDLLRTCACEFKALLPYRYHIIAGRKGNMIDFTISFDEADFHHLAGLHKLRDNVRFQTGKRSDIFREILDGKLTFAQAAQSQYFHEMEPRLKPLSGLQMFLDSNEMVFRYNFKINMFSLIRADYLLQNDYDGTSVYLFLAQRTGEDTQVCRTFFPKADKDYAKGQPRYTLLKKEKINLQTGETEIQYDRLTSKQK